MEIEISIPPLTIGPSNSRVPPLGHHVRLDSIEGRVLCLERALATIGSWLGRIRHMSKGKDTGSNSNDSDEHEGQSRDYVDDGDGGDDAATGAT
ncbi:unnamed protein product [Ilex paraguariensis]|uniref:Uncharacterized protein n=1 Tax=Ilex paraguariensis TaxID=185542 RepID=A0ABC8SWW4_9AQUA